MGEYSSQIKNHPLHRPVAMYFEDKKEMQKEAILEAELDKKLKKEETRIWIRELKKNEANFVKEKKPNKLMFALQEEVQGSPKLRDPRR